MYTSIPDQPIMYLFKRLINNDCKENTVLTNSQILYLLRKEFNVNLSELHELEVDIYLGVLKKFLKLWPQWDEFDKVVNELKTKGDNDDIDKLLETKHTDLKNYLKLMLDIAEPMAKEMLNSINEKNKNKDVLMEVHCSRSQLNKLFYKQPVPELNHTILNLTDSAPSKITVGVLPLRAILNWWFIEINFNFKNVIFIRKTRHTLKHLLVNTKLGNPIIDKTPLDMNFYEMKQKRVLSYAISKSEVIDIVHKINNLSADAYMKEIVHVVSDMFLKDIELAPKVLTVPTVYKRKCSRYPYMRYLYTDVDNITEDMENKHDLRLQETIVPEYEVSIRKIDTETKLQQINPSRTTYIQVECKLCMVRFSGSSMNVNLINHFTSFHMNEPNWMCVNCNGEFAMADLCENWWYHQC